MPETARGLTMLLDDEAATMALGLELSLFLRRGDLLTLSGDLGAGKTTLARAIVRAFCGDEEIEVPSPTFTLVQPYLSSRGALSHFDLYRISDPGEVEELGLDDSVEDGIALVEWPDRLGADVPGERLDIHIEDVSGEGRAITLSGHGTWTQRLERIHQVRAFFDAGEWRGCDRRFLQGDASARRYERITKDGRNAIFMDMPSQPDGPAIQDGLPYSAIAHLAEGVGPFVAIDQALRGLGLSAPAIMASDTERGFLIIEDLGDEVYGTRIARGDDMTEPYHAAVDLLAGLRGRADAGTVGLAATDDGPDEYSIPSYDRRALSVETNLLLEWFWPRVHGGTVPEDARSSFDALWNGLFNRLDGEPAIWTLRDFHSPNLIWLADRQGDARVGLIDFQDAVLGHPAYDLVSLLQDARTTVPQERETVMLARYCAAVADTEGGFDEARFRMAYAILGAQRASKILGIFVRLADRDGKLGYLQHVPRVSVYLERNLAHPALADLKAWFDRHLPTETRTGI